MIDILENKELAPYTTLRVGGRARFFTTVRTLEELEEACQLSRKEHLAIFILGEGSNVLVGDSGFDGLTIKMDIRGVKFEDRDGGNIVVTAGAGERWDSLVEQSLAKGLYGIENLSFIPGTVGATPIQNVGAYGVEVKDIIDTVFVFDSKTRTSKKFANSECQFSYRDSLFKRKKNLIVTHVSYRLRKEKSLTLTYKDVLEELRKRKLFDPTLKEIREVIGIIRKRKFPSTKDVGTAGSFFKNPILGKNQYDAIKKSHPGLPCFEMGDGDVKVSLAWILERGGWKGYRRGTVGSFENQPLVLVNFGGATADELKRLSDDIAVDMKNRGISIDPEVTFVGKF